MNIFQDIPSVIFIRNMSDINYVNDFLIKTKISYVNVCNNLSNIKIGDILIRQNNYYIVKPLDTLEGIAKKLNVTVDHIKSKNQIKNLYVGQKLEI